MEILATTEEKLGLVHSALCSGLPYFVDYGYQLVYSDIEYMAAQKALTDAKAKGKYTDTICIEDVQTQMLRMGFDLVFKGDSDEGGEAETATLNLKTIEANWPKVPGTTVLQFWNESDDAMTCDVLMQYLLLGEVVYG